MTKTVKMWSHMHGIVDVTERIGEQWPLSYRRDGWYRAFTSEGIHRPTDSHPTLISMEQAEKMGLVKRKTPKNGYRVKYYSCSKDEYRVTLDTYPSQQEFERYNKLKFICFVDNTLNEVGNDVEWEEVPQ